ncbi:hypothetical protein GCM10010486_67880 [Nonomuraea roseoviolacea subsp. carminata]
MVTGERQPVPAGHAGLGGSKQGPFLVRGPLHERVHYVDLTTGKLWRRKH